jgi:hypothetical protein
VAEGRWGAAAAQSAAEAWEGDVLRRREFSDATSPAQLHPPASGWQEASSEDAAVPEDSAAAHDEL